MNERGREKLINSYLRRAVHYQLVNSRDWNPEIDKLSLEERRQLKDYADDLQSRLRAYGVDV